MPAVLNALRHTRRQQRHLWVALVAVLWLALAPTVSHALAAARGGDPWREICSVQGAQQVADEAAAAGKATPDAARHLFDHCPMCGLPALLAPPPAVQRVAFVDPRGQALPALYLAAPHTLHAWRPASARAPPPAL